MEQSPNNNSLQSTSLESGALKEKNPYFREMYLETIDESTLTDIFKEILEKSGQEEKLRRFRPIKDIELVYKPEEKYSGSSISSTGEILLNEAYLNGDSKESTSTIVLEILIHEEVHNLSGSEIVEGDFETVQNIGFLEKTIDRVTGAVAGKVFEMFNEGMTELIKDDVLAEYVKRTGDRTKVTLNGYKQGELSPYRSYMEGRYMVNNAIEKLASSTGVPGDTVREALVTAYFSSLSMNNFKDELKEVCGTDLALQLNSPDTELIQENIETLTELQVAAISAGKEEYFLSKAIGNFYFRSLSA